MAAQGDTQAEVFREVNDRIRRLADSSAATAAREFICECDDHACLDIVALTPAEFDARRVSGAPLLAFGHAERATSPSP